MISGELRDNGKNKNTIVNVIELKNPIPFVSTPLLFPFDTHKHTHTQTFLSLVSTADSFFLTHCLVYKNRDYSRVPTN